MANIGRTNRFYKQQNKQETKISSTLQLYFDEFLYCYSLPGIEDSDFDRLDVRRLPCSSTHKI
jgi:hypothetical protein